LPLAHIYELAVQLTALWPGAAVGFWRGDILGLTEDMQALKPTIFVGVPRVFNRVYDKIMAQLSEGSPIKRALFNYAYSTKKAAMDAGFKASSIWDTIVFKKIQDALGGRVRIITTGSAPLSPTVQEFLRVYALSHIMGLTDLERKSHFSFVSAPQTQLSFKGTE